MLNIESLRFPRYEQPASLAPLREEVRAFLDESLKAYSPLVRSNTWDGFDPDFSRKLGAKGWMGMTLPKAYGGHERSALERYVIVEETLAAGAPVGFHWIADRQSGPVIARYGTEAKNHPRHHARRGVLLHRHERTQLGFGSGVGQNPRRQGSRRLAGQRHQDLDH